MLLLDGVSLAFLLVLRTKTEGLGTLVQKIIVQQLGNVHQQGKVDALAFQHLVGVGTVTVDGLGKPSHGAPLPRQLRFNHVPDMHLVSHCNSVCLTILPGKKRP